MTASPRNLAALLSWFLLALVAGCTTTAPEPAQPMSEQSRFLVDPRIGFPGETSRRTQRDFESGWLMFREGRLASAERELQALLRRDPDYRPAVLGLAAVALERGQIERTASLIAQAQQGLDSYLAARIYEAELEVSRGNLEQALGIYDQIVQQPQAPTVSVRRREQLKIYLIDRLLAAAKSAVEPLAREELSRRLLSLDPDSFDARLLLVHALLEQRRFDSARAEIQPLLDHGLAAREEVQAALAEIDVGTGRFQEAIQRYERLVRTGTHPHYRARLEQIKELWQEANLPPRYRQALASPALTRAEAAILAYWRVSAVRFAQNLPPPPIAVDLAGIAGREELVRALALGLFPIDPLTRRADPSRTITADRLMRLGATLLSLHPRPACVSLAGTGVEKPTSMEILRACNVDLGNLPAERDRFVSGEVAVRILDQIDDVLHSAEQSQAGQ